MTQISQGSPLAIKKISAGGSMYAHGGMKRRDMNIGGMVGKMDGGDHVPNMADGGEVKKNRFRSKAEKAVDKLYGKKKKKSEITEYASGERRRSRLEEQERKALGMKDGGKVMNYADGGLTRKKKVNPRAVDPEVAAKRREQSKQSRKKAGETIRSTARKVGKKAQQVFDRAVLAHDRLRAKAKARRKRIQDAKAQERRMRYSGEGSPVKLKMDTGPIKTEKQRRDESRARRKRMVSSVSRGT